MAAYFTRGTTPDFRFEVDEDLTGWDVYVTFGQGKRAVATLKCEPVATEGGSAVEGRLTQAQTLAFKEGDGSAQLRAYRNGVAGATGCWDFEVRRIILDGEIPREVGA